MHLVLRETLAWLVRDLFRVIVVAWIVLIGRSPANGSHENNTTATRNDNQK